MRIFFFRSTVCLALFCFFSASNVFAVDTPSGLRVKSVSASGATIVWEKTSGTEYAVFNIGTGAIVSDFSFASRAVIHGLLPQNLYTYMVVARDAKTLEMSRFSEAVRVNTLPPGGVPPGERKSIDPFIYHTGRDMFLGDSTAPVTLLVYTDFSCPYCAVWHKTIEAFMSDKKGEVRLAYRHFPVKSIHPDAVLRAHAVECSKAAGVWKEFMPRAFVSGKTEATSSSLRAVAEEVHADMPIFDKCMADFGRFGWRFLQDYTAGEDAGAGGTPFTIVLRGKKKIGTISGAVPKSELERVVGRK